MRRRLVHLVVSAGIVAATSLVVGVPQAAAVTSCPPDIVGTTVSGDVVVPANAQCTISNSTVTGNVTVNAGATLFLEGSTIDGSVTATHPASFSADALGPCGVGGCARTNVIQGNVTVDGTTGATNLGANFMCTGIQIGGSLSITNSGPNAPWDLGASGFCGPGDYRIGKTVRFSGNAAQVRFENFHVGGAVSASGNSGPRSDLENNVIASSLSVQNNHPCWTVSGNTVSGVQSVQPCP